MTEKTIEDLEWVAERVMDVLDGRKGFEIGYLKHHDKDIYDEIREEIAAAIEQAIGEGEDG